MKIIFVKRDTFTSKEGKDYFTITSLIGKCLAHSFVNKDTYDWFSNAIIGDVIPSEFTSTDLYESNNRLLARVNISINKKK